MDKLEQAIVAELLEKRTMRAPQLSYSKSPESKAERAAFLRLLRRGVVVEYGRADGRGKLYALKERLDAEKAERLAQDEAAAPERRARLLALIEQASPSMLRVIVSHCDYDLDQLGL